LRLDGGVELNGRTCSASDYLRPDKRMVSHGGCAFHRNLARLKDRGCEKSLIKADRSLRSGLHPLHSVRGSISLYGYWVSTPQRVARSPVPSFQMIQTFQKQRNCSGTRFFDNVKQTAPCLCCNPQDYIMEAHLSGRRNDRDFSVSTRCNKSNNRKLKASFEVLRNIACLNSSQNLALSSHDRNLAGALKVWKGCNAKLNKT
jgi:hypothetical protein